jgi:hypothetical protein
MFPGLDKSLQQRAGWMHLIMRRLLAILALLLCAAPAFAAQVQHQIANAPIWRPSHSYTHTGHIGDRVLVSAGAPAAAATMIYGGESLVLPNGANNFKFGTANGSDWHILLDTGGGYSDTSGSGVRMGVVAGTTWVQNSLGDWWYYSGGWQGAYSFTAPFEYGGGPNLPGIANSPQSLIDWTDGTPVYLLELTSAGTSGGSMPAPSSCPMTGIPDGGATWRCLTQIDYPDMMSALSDNPTIWAPGGNYREGQIVYFNHQTWWMCAGPTPSGQPVCPGSGWPKAPNYTCTAGSTGPSVPKGPNLDGTCAWIKVADVVYSPNHANGYLPAVSLDNPTLSAGPVEQTSANHIYNLWSGGSAVPVYNKIVFQGQHQWLLPVANAIGGGEVRIICTGTGDITLNVNIAGCWSNTVRPADNDSMCNWPAGTPLAYDALPAVKIEQAGNMAIQTLDFGYHFDCLQIKNYATTYPAVGGKNPPDNYYGMINFNRDIIDCTGSPCLIQDAMTILHNSLCVSRYTGSYAACLETKYVNAILNSTLVSLGSSTNSVPQVMDCETNIHSPYEADGAPSIYNNIFVGWAQQIAWNNCFGAQYNYTGNATFNNATDRSVTQAPGNWTSPWTGNGVGTTVLGGTGTQYNQAASSIFVNPTNDFRLKSGAAQIGAGVTYTKGTRGQYSYVTFTPDMFGNVRPTTGGSYDLGPAQFSGSPPPKVPQRAP